MSEDRPTKLGPQAHAFAAPLQNLEAAAPLQNLEAEESVLGAMLLSHRAIAAVRDVLEREDFYRQSHGTIYQTIVEIYEREVPVDVISVVDDLERRRALEAVGGRSRLQELAALVPATTNAVHHAQIVYEQAVLRRLTCAAGEIRRLALDRPGDLNELVERAEVEVLQVSRSVSPAMRDGTFAIAASELEPRSVTWLEPARIPLGAVTLLVGDPGLGKSLYTCSLAARLSRGDLGEPGVSLFVSAEDDRNAVIRPRLEAAGAVLDLIRFVSVRRHGIEEGISLPGDVHRLGRLVAEYRARLVVIDPLTAHLPQAIDSWRDQSVRRALAPLHRLAEQHGCAVVAVAHLNKSATTDPLRRIGGSVAFPAAARSVLLLARDPRDPEGEAGCRRASIHVKCNLGPLAPAHLHEVVPVVLRGSKGCPQIDTARLGFVEQVDYRARDLLGPFDDEERSALSDAEEFLREELGGGPVTAKAIFASAKEAGHSERTIRRAAKPMGVKKKRVGGVGGHWEWSLPTAGISSVNRGQSSWPPSENGHLGHVRQMPLEKGDGRPSQPSDALEDGQLPQLGIFDRQSDTDVDVEYDRIARKFPDLVQHHVLGDDGYLEHLFAAFEAGWITEREWRQEDRAHRFAANAIA